MELGQARDIDDDAGVADREHGAGAIGREIDAEGAPGEGRLVDAVAGLAVEDDNARLGGVLIEGCGEHDGAIVGHSHVAHAAAGVGCAEVVAPFGRAGAVAAEALDRDAAGVEQEGAELDILSAVGRDDIGVQRERAELPLGRAGP